MPKSSVKPGDLVRRIVNPSYGLAVVVRIFSKEYIEILCNDGTLKTVFYDAVEAVSEAG